nr:uncharacterized protein LOC121502734 [Drosophila kikkawai]
MDTTKKSASDLVGEVKPQKPATDSELDEEELLRSDDETLAPSISEGSAKTSTPQAAQPTTSKAAASQAKATGEHGKSKPWTHQQRKAQASKAHFILAKIARNEKEGKADPRDLADKARYLAVIEEYERFEKKHPETLLPPQTKRNRSQEVSESAPKRAKDAKGAPRPTTFVKTAKKFSEGERVIKTLRAMNKGVDMEDWAILKAEREMKTSQPYLFLINQRCLEQLKAADNKVRYGIRKAKVKVFLDEPDDILEDEVEDANKLLDDLAIDDSSPNTTPI